MGSGCSSSIMCDSFNTEYHTIKEISILYCITKILKVPIQGLSHDSETGCPKLTIVKYLGILFFKGGNTILR